MVRYRAMSDNDDKNGKSKNPKWTLSEQEKQKLKERFGIEYSEDMDLSEVKKQFEITREKIREIEKKARKKLDNDSDPEDSA
ncbi:MAG: sigma factor-like helix-turn-helix DNA-binding protein [Gammaproteobacteria bacterium]|nr:sigma factor-like helix-turn-helix DNA-binding protein [Gammaproteobacteria bacterium]